MSESVSGYSLLRSVRITDTSAIVDNSTATNPDYYTYTDAESTAWTFYNRTGSSAAVGDRIIVLADQDNYMMKAADYANTYVGADGGMSAITSLTVSTGGTASNTLAAMTVTTPADLAAVAAQLVIIQNSIKSLGAKVNEILAAND